MCLTARVQKQVFCMRLTVDMCLITMHVCLTTRVYGSLLKVGSAKSKKASVVEMST